MIIQCGRKLELLGMDIMFHIYGSISIGMENYLRDKIDMFTEEILGPALLASYKALDCTRNNANKLDKKPRYIPFYCCNAAMVKP